ncbi:hypothetical protein FNV43_RR08190 [Rhamnella rubrinervis]|uniref:Reverse transcriptase zinc-binding domain-containing protein n=1 Tax=Rhamnella rubrinervis TaxID=2594499 RepID=A0A8K0HH65_9ROSA|nr:hypothetical protein FNV43_RR08190 [Rhamnella rubrinervis]
MNSKVLPTIRKRNGMDIEGKFSSFEPNNCQSDVLNNISEMKQTIASIESREVRCWDVIKEIPNLDQWVRSSRAPQFIQVVWSPPPRGWLKVNTDGAADGCPGPGGCGGFFVTSRGFIKAFSDSSDSCYAFETSSSGFSHLEEEIVADASFKILLFIDGGGSSDSCWMREFELIQSQVPFLVKIFIFDYLRWLHHRYDVLNMRGFFITSICRIYGKDSKTISHLFFTCPYAAAIWECLGVIFGISFDALGSVVYMFEKAMEASSSTQVFNLWTTAIVSALSVIWFVQNQGQFGNVFIPLTRSLAFIWASTRETNATMHNSVSNLLVFKSLGMAGAAPRSPQIILVVWSPPPMGWLKVNTGDLCDGMRAEWIFVGISSLVFIPVVSVVTNVHFFKFIACSVWVWRGTNLVEMPPPGREKLWLPSNFNRLCNLDAVVVVVGIPDLCRGARVGVGCGFFVSGFIDHDRKTLQWASLSSDLLDLLGSYRWARVSLKIGLLTELVPSIICFGIFEIVMALFVLDWNYLAGLDNTAGDQALGANVAQIGDSAKAIPKKGIEEMSIQDTLNKQVPIQNIPK